ncbi:hypothetical protein ZOSMA_84G00200 [Zostera marina]|uniref:Uncharacterized protein n=1 Tax=Zostera marina TaxID=29655 RepID=A0A0K9NLV0_ZOSMR|nr:hypothetical protein ZOSMA_84G00200 [Zostera marina]
MKVMMAEEDEEEEKMKQRMSQVSKESSTENPSFRYYYSVKVGAVPFHWEIQPGTPRHPNSAVNNTSLLPPLTPPPSYLLHQLTNDAQNSKKIVTTSTSHYSKFRPIFRALILPKYFNISKKRDRTNESSSTAVSSTRSCSLGTLLFSSPSVSSSGSTSSKPVVSGRKSWKTRSSLGWSSSSTTSSMHNFSDDDDTPKSMACLGMRNINVMFFTKCRSNWFPPPPPSPPDMVLQSLES